MQVKYSPNATLYVTASKDGDIKIWDGISSKCVNTFVRAHDGNEVCSVTFSRNSKVCIYVCNRYLVGNLNLICFLYYSLSKLMLINCITTKLIASFHEIFDPFLYCNFSLSLQYVLSSGKDSLVKLWELSTSRCLIAYTGAGTTGIQERRTNAVFNHTEDYGKRCFTLMQHLF